MKDEKIIFYDPQLESKVTETARLTLEEVMKVVKMEPNIPIDSSVDILYRCC